MGWGGIGVTPSETSEDFSSAWKHVEVILHQCNVGSDVTPQRIEGSDVDCGRARVDYDVLR